MCDLSACLVYALRGIHGDSEVLCLWLMMCDLAAYAYVEFALEKKSLCS